MHAVFKPAMQKGAEIWTSPPHIFTKGGLLQVSRILCSSSISRDINARKMDGTIDRLDRLLLYQPWLTFETMLHTDAKTRCFS